MANEILKLSEIDIHEINKKTKIPVEYIKPLIARDYDALKGANVKAYLKILEREYGIDLSSYMDDFSNFSSENSTNENPKIQVNPKLTGYAAKETHNSFGWLVFALILLGAGVWGFKMLKDVEFSDFTPDFLQIPSLSAEGNSSDENTSEVVVITPSADFVPYEENTTKSGEALEMTQNSSLEQNAQDIQNEQNSTLVIEQNASETELKSGELLDENAKKELSSDAAKFYPTKTIWVGIKNLSDMSKRSFSSKEPFDVNLTGERLVLTGHGLVDILVADDNQSYKTRDALRFYAHDGKLEKIDYDEYVKLNKGKTW